MKHLLSYLLIVSVLLSSFSSMVSFAGYEWNKSFIARVLCINKDVPQSGCHGKCHLKKELQKQEDQQSKSGNPIKEKETTWSFAISAADSFQSVPVEINTTHFSYKTELLDIPFVKSVFHPPAILVA